MAAAGNVYQWYSEDGVLVLGKRTLDPGGHQRQLSTLDGNPVFYLIGPALRAGKSIPDNTSTHVQAAGGAVFSLQRNHSGRRVRNPPVPGYSCRGKESFAHLRQADGLLPAFHLDAGGNPGNPVDFNRQ